MSLQDDGMESSIRRAQETNDPCVFCPENWHSLDILARPWHWVAIIKPKDPVVPGHALVIHRLHTASAKVDPEVSASLMEAACEYLQENAIDHANLITSIGHHATQTVMHTHLHIVPRTPQDGLMLPWTNQHEARHRDWSRDHEGPMPEDWRR